MVTCACVAWTTFGCASAEAPYEDLRLRDALQAEPSAIAEMPLSKRQRLAQRFESAIALQASESSVSRASAIDLPGYAAVIDSGRVDAEEDALVMLEADVGAHVVELRTLNRSGDRGDGGVAASVPSFDEMALAVDDERLLEAPYAAALHGRAGEIIARLAFETGAARIRATANVPIGLIADGDTLYVNLAWLVAFSDGSDLATVSRTTVALAGTPYRQVPFSQCAAEAQTRCNDCLVSGLCGGEPELTGSFTSLSEECLWLEMDPSRYERLCVVGWMSVRSIRTCVMGREGSCPVIDTDPTTTSVDAAVPFQSDSVCMSALETCGSDRVVPAGGCFENACQGFFDNCGAALASACADSCSTSCNNACSSSSCSGGCSGTSCSGGSCGGGSCGSTSCGGGGSSCSVGEAEARRVERSSTDLVSTSSGLRIVEEEKLPSERGGRGPWSLLWALLPLAYLAVRARKP